MAISNKVKAVVNRCLHVYTCEPTIDAIQESVTIIISGVTSMGGGGVGTTDTTTGV